MFSYLGSHKFSTFLNSSKSSDDFSNKSFINDNQTLKLEPNLKVEIDSLTIQFVAVFNVNLTFVFHNLKIIY